MAPKIHRGRFVWHELLTTDPKAAQKFYTQIVGWRAQAWPENPSYFLWMNGETMVGGLMALPDDAKKAGAPPHWMGYVATPDVDATTKQATKLGATVLVEPQDIPSVGRFSVLQDPQGAVFAAFQPSDEPTPRGAESAIGEVSWNELGTKDYDSALAFYGKLFGWEQLDTYDMGAMGDYVIYGVDGVKLGGVHNKPDDQGPPAFTYYIKVKDVKPAAEQVKKLGGSVLHGPAEVPGGGWIVIGQDPQGAVFALHSAAK